MEKWFLFHPNYKDNEINSNNQITLLTNIDKKKFISRVSLDRLEQQKYHGGMNLKQIKNIFSASKSKTLMRSLLSENKNKFCYILLDQMIEKIYIKQPKYNFIHPLFYTNADDEIY